MNTEELEERLSAEGVSKRAYSINEEISDEQYVLENETDGIWSVFYSERGKRTGEERFETETEACRYMLHLVLNDPLTRVNSGG